MRSELHEPARLPLDLGGEPALSIDVEEWYHSCWVPEYVDPERRPPLVEELDRLLPELGERLERAGARATLFVLGEVARRLPVAIRDLDRAGHEIACHGDLHLRANERSTAGFRDDVARAKAQLEDLIGKPVAGFRAPEWSLRTTANPRLRAIVELGFRYDSSLMPARGAGSPANPTLPTELRWADGLTLLELPPLTFRCPGRMPASGWTARQFPPGLLARVVRSAAEAGGLPLLTVHPWEVVTRPCPGLFTGFARLFHDAGRVAFATRFDELLGELRTRATLVERTAAAPSSLRGRTRAVAAPTEVGFTRRPVEGSIG